ncbi:unnamed protein product [Darwinula stevensoni]|uniref:Eukaryotic translation initiation factor 4E transporter n=1 Tax=Darwinula stevensoni TaxID=69355 RepID=A0A7R9FNZ1_9CRUS|nr:unnamed protein product [Darwinula stevensoni]CAG0897284.1 unnamed protein product [Darwinula stevensoni]
MEEISESCAQQPPRPASAPLSEVHRPLPPARVMSHEAPAAIDDDDLESAEKFADSGFIDSSSLNTERKLPRHRYSKLELEEIRENGELCKQKPSYLDPAFLNEKGRWDPAKWHASLTGMSHHKSIGLKEGGRLRDPKDRLLREEQDDIILSPQRKSFGTGCHASFSLRPSTRPDSPPGPTMERERERDHSGMRDMHPIPHHPPMNRRVGSGRIFSRDRELVRDRDYGYQEGGRSRTGNRYQRPRREEEEPEWFSGGPTSQHDVIELRGFDDDVNEDPARTKVSPPGSKVEGSGTGQKILEMLQRSEEDSRKGGQAILDFANQAGMKGKVVRVSELEGRSPDDQGDLSAFNRLAIGSGRTTTPIILDDPAIQTAGTGMKVGNTEAPQRLPSEQIRASQAEGGTSSYPPELVAALKRANIIPELLTRPQAQAIITGLCKGQITQGHLIEQLQKSVMPAVLRETVRSILTLVKARMTLELLLLPPQGMRKTGSGPSTPTHDQGIVPSAPPAAHAAGNRVPSPQELAAHTQQILQNALIKKHLMVQEENFRKRQQQQLPQQRVDSGDMRDEVGQKAAAPSTLAFTPTSVMRKMNSTANLPPSNAVSANYAGENGGVMGMGEVHQTRSITKAAPQSGLGGRGMLPQGMMGQSGMKAPTQATVPAPGGRMGGGAGWGGWHTSPPPPIPAPGGFANLNMNMNATPAAASPYVVPPHMRFSNLPPNILLTRPPFQPHVRDGGKLMGHAPGMDKGAGGDGLSQWFGPEILSQGGGPQVPMQKALSLEEVERLQQFQAATVKN